MADTDEDGYANEDDDSTTMPHNGTTQMEMVTETIQQETMRIYSRTIRANGTIRMVTDMGTIRTNSSTMEANGTILMETGTVTMPTVLELTCSPTIPANGTIPMETALATTATGLQAMEHKARGR